MTAVGTGPPPARVLAAHPVLGVLPASTLGELGARAREEVFAAGQVVVREGEPGDRLFLILEGRGEVSVATRSGPVPIAVVEPGDMIGEVALLSGSGRRQATITTLSELRTVSIDFGAFGDLLAAHPEIAADLGELTRRQRTARFLRRASPFTRLTKAQADELAAKLEHRAFGPGEDIVRQGEEGDACYVVVSGEVEVRLRADDGRERVLTRLGVGALFGETALLTPAPRSATVRAAAGGGPCEVVALHRDDLLGVVCADADLGRLMQEFVRLRYRPRRAEHVTAHPRETPDGDVIVTLRDERRLAYYRLSPEGWFLWQRLDGDRTLKDLTLDYFHEFKAFAPDRIAEILAGLARAGFVVGPTFHRELLDATGDGSGARAGGGLSALLRRGLDWRLTLRNVDGFFARLYDHGGWVLFTRPARLLAAALAAAGAVAFVHVTGRVAEGLRGADAAALLLVYPATVVVVVLHEFGHALATKAAGRRVNGAGVGWYWFAPIAFIDTTDMWLSDRRDRIAVSLAGPAVNLVLGGIAALAGAVLAPGLAQQIAWQFALICYVGTALNLNPLLEYDGYHVLVDVLDRPGLRRRAFAWLGRNLPGALFDPVAWRRHTVELVYGLSSALYVVAMAGVAFWLIRTFVEDRLAPVLTPAGASAVAWTAALLLALAALIGLWRDMRTADAG